MVKKRKMKVIFINNYVKNQFYFWCKDQPRKQCSPDRKAYLRPYTIVEVYEGIPQEYDNKDKICGVQQKQKKQIADVVDGTSYHYYQLFGLLLNQPTVWPKS